MHPGVSTIMSRLGLSGSRSDPEQPAPGGAPCIVVSADAGLRSAIGEMLTECGVAVTPCRNRWTARISARRQPPELLVVDWRLARDGARRLLAEIRGIAGSRAAFVLGVVPGGDQQLTHDALASGVDDLLTLPLARAAAAARLRLVTRRLTSAATDGESVCAAPTGAVSTGADPVTGLPGREALIEHLDRVTASGSRGHRRPALLVCGLDRFETINAGLGLIAGDALLKGVARRLRALCSPPCSLARINGAQLALLLPEIDQIGEATAWADRIRATLRAPVRIETDDVFPSVSIGIATWESAYQRPDELLRDAEAALHTARAHGTSRTEVFRPEIRTQIVERIRLEHDLRRALAHDELEVRYQPILSLSDGRIEGFEALARWRHPERGLLLPDEFIPLAERQGLVIEIDRRVAEVACSQLRAWQVAFRRTPPLTMSVNASTTQFRQPDLVSHFDLTLRTAGLYGRSLAVEVTESALLHDAEYAAAMLAELRRLGMRISIDDFGTGYSSLAYLRRFEVDTLKIDRSFVARVPLDQESSEIVRSITSLAVNLGKVTVAEGVETKSQLEAIRELGVDHAQGFFVAPPLDAEAAGELLTRTSDSSDHLRAILDDRLHHGGR